MNDPGRTRRVVPLPLSPHAWAELVLPHPLTAAEWAQLLATLAAMRPGLVAEEETVEDGDGNDEPAH